MEGMAFRLDKLRGQSAGHECLYILLQSNYSSVTGHLIYIINRF